MGFTRKMNFVSLMALVAFVGLALVLASCGKKEGEAGKDGKDGKDGKAGAAAAKPTTPKGWAEKTAKAMTSLKAGDNEAAAKLWVEADRENIKKAPKPAEDAPKTTMTFEKVEMRGDDKAIAFYKSKTGDKETAVELCLVKEGDEFLFSTKAMGDYYKDKAKWGK